MAYHARTLIENNLLNPKISQIVYAKLEVGWHHSLNRREFEQVPGGGEGQRNWCAAIQGVPKSWKGLSN